MEVVLNILSPTSCFWKKSKSKSEMGATVSLLLSYPPDLLMKESSGRQFPPPAKGSETGVRSRNLREDEL